MRNFSFIRILLSLFLLATVVSCTNPAQFYSSQQYQNASDSFDQLKNPTVEDYYIKLKSLLALGKNEEARESILLYMLLSDDQQKREEVSRYFISENYSNELNVTILRPTDSLESQITLYKSYIELKDYANARSIVNDYLVSELSLEELTTLIINYPLDSDFIITMLSIWQTTLTDSDKDTYLLLLKRFSKLESISESSAKVCVDITTRLEGDEYYCNDNQSLITIYTIKADILQQLHDVYNSNLYRRLAQQLEELNEE